MRALALLACLSVPLPALAAGRAPPPKIVTRAMPGWKQRGEIHDVTARFGANYTKALAGTLQVPKAARGVMIFIVPGTGGNEMPRYFAATETHLRDRGYQVERSQIGTLNGTPRNAKQIAAEMRAIVARGYDLVILSHSKGGPDEMEAEALAPDLAPHIRARVPLQPADGGVPGAGLLDNPIARFGMRLARTDGQLMKSMRPHERQAMKARAPHDLSVPTLVLASTKQDGSLRGKIARTIAGGPTKRGGEHWDGMVPRWSQLIPGTHAVILPDMDHGEPVFTLPGRKYEPGPLAEAMIVTALRLPR